MCLRMAPCIVAYSMKANPIKQIPTVLSNTHARFEISSLAEAETLCMCGIEPHRMHCGIVVATQEELLQIESKGCNVFTFDSYRQLEKLKNLRHPSKKILRIRVNDLVPDSIGFGMPYDVILSNPYILTETYGLSFHISDHTNMTKTIEAIDRLVALTHLSKTIKLLNIGGSYSLSGNEDDYCSLRSHLHEIRQNTGLEIICEPGSALIDSSMYALTKCVMIYEQDGFTDVFIDGGISSGMTRRPRNIINLSNKVPIKRHFYRFFDTTSMKKLLFQLHLPIKIQENDVLCFSDYGAYSYCYSNIFHSRPIPQVHSIKELKLIDELV